MDKRDIQKVKPKTCVLYGEHTQTRLCHDVRVAEVVFVTRNGGVRLKDKTGREFWIPCHHVIKIKEDGFLGYNKFGAKI